MFEFVIAFSRLIHLPHNLSQRSYGENSAKIYFISKLNLVNCEMFSELREFDSVSMHSYQSTVLDSEYVASDIKRYENEMARNNLQNSSEVFSQQMFNLNIHVISNGKSFRSFTRNY